jgi:futalosine hydrolase
MTAVAAEQEAVERGLTRSRASACENADGQAAAADFAVCIAGVGPVAAAIATLAELYTGDYDLVISAGIGGGFPGRAEIGSLVVADAILAADLGAETPDGDGDGFLSLDALGFGSAQAAVDGKRAARLTALLQEADLPVTLGPVLTASAATGTAATAQARAARTPGAAAEGMEGFGVAVAAQTLGLPVLELRAISNAVGPRDRAAWQIGRALDALAAACALLPDLLDERDLPSLVNLTR